MSNRSRVISHGRVRRGCSHESSIAHEPSVMDGSGGDAVMSHESSVIKGCRCRCHKTSVTPSFSEGFRAAGLSLGWAWVSGTTHRPV